MNGPTVSPKMLKGVILRSLAGTMISKAQGKGHLSGVNMDLYTADPANNRQRREYHHETTSNGYTDGQDQLNGTVMLGRCSIRGCVCARSDELADRLIELEFRDEQHVCAERCSPHDHNLHLVLERAISFTGAVKSPHG
jgi:hypothetical protein